MKLDIQIIGNCLEGRQGWAYVCNSGRFAVLTANTDNVGVEFKGYGRFGKVKVAQQTKSHGEITSTGTLYIENGTLGISCGGACISSRFDYSDMMEIATEANLPVLRENNIVAVAFHSDKTKVATLGLYRVSKVNINCMTAATLESLTNEEMKGIAIDAEMWCRR